MTTHAFTAAEDPVDSDDPPAATVPLPTGLADVIAVVSVMAALLLVYSIAASETSWADAMANHDLHNIDLAAVLGALILRRRPGHVIGWVLVAVGAFESVALLSGHTDSSGSLARPAWRIGWKACGCPASHVWSLRYLSCFPTAVCSRPGGARWRGTAWPRPSCS